MATQAETAKELLNKLNMGTSQEKVGDFIVEQATRQGVAVADAASAPTQAEFNALLTSLRNAGLIATS